MNSSLSRSNYTCTVVLGLHFEQVHSYLFLIGGINEDDILHLTINFSI